LLFDISALSDSLPLSVPVWDHGLKVYFTSLGKLREEFRSVLQITKISNNDFIFDIHINNPVTLLYLLFKK